MLVYVLIRMQSGILEDCACYLDRQDAKDAFQFCAEGQPSNQDIMLVECSTENITHPIPGDVIDESYGGERK